MPSPIPGVDPYIEGQKWRDFHASMIFVIREVLTPRITPRYVVDIYTVPKTRIRRQRRLEIRERLTKRLVTVIEVLSPTNKTDGYRDYLAKRNEILSSPIHLVELDLLRSGRRVPTVEPLQPSDYYAFVIRHERLPHVEVYGWPLPHPLPTIPVPLKEGDPDVSLDLQGVFASVYDRAGYRYSLDYELPVVPPLPETAATWVKQTLEAWLSAAT